jgi:hypothetical protein
VVRKQKEAVEKAERGLQTKIRKDTKGQVTAKKEAEKEAEKQAKAKEKLARAVPRKKAKVKPRAKKAATRPKKKVTIFKELTKEVGPVEPAKTSFTGRTLKLLQRYKK